MAKYKIIPSSRTIVQSPISIGHKAEKGVEAIEFDLTAWVETYGSGTATIIMRRWGDEIPYPVALELDENNKATWTLSDIDTAKAGMAYAQVSYIVGDEVVKKSDIYTFRVMDSLTGEGEPPEAYESWLEQLTHIAAEAMAEVLDIEGIVTDKTLTVDGGIADGKATGDALALKADKATTYTKTEVDRMIEGVEIETDTTLTIEGAAADAAETGRQIDLLKADLDAIVPGLSDDAKAALIDCFSNVVWDGDGQAYINVLKTALGVVDNPFEDAEYELGAFGYNQKSDGSSGCVTKNDTLTTRVRAAIPVSCKHGRLTAKTGYEINMYMLNSRSYGEWATTDGISIVGYNDLTYVGTAYYQWRTEKEILTGTKYCIVVVRKTSGDTFTQNEANNIYGTGFIYEEV